MCMKYYWILYQTDRFQADLEEMNLDAIHIHIIFYYNFD